MARIVRQLWGKSRRTAGAGALALAGLGVLTGNVLARAVAVVVAAPRAHAAAPPARRARARS